jgi:hypothetical protein
MKTHPTTSIFGVLFYVLAAVTGLILICISTWGDMEADSYGFPRRANSSLSGLDCPILLTRDETGVISVTVSNPTDQPLHPSARTEISAPFEPEVFIESIDLNPGESKTLEWSLKPENIVLGNFILANVQVYASYPIPNREKTCGILIMDLPGSGRMIVLALAVFTLIGLGWGLYAMKRSDVAGNRGGSIWNAILFLSALIFIGLILSFTGSWVPSIGVLVLSVLTSVLLLSTTILRGS